ncbi:MAG: serine/threonine protein kinase [Planctomycetes bacterium]|nr:serine/threonine protein kinase [Planctomycetota bacterium]
MDLATLRLLEELGRGAMGTVYRAFDPASGRDVALKILNSGSVERFEREGVLSARLDHPSIVRVHASGVREGRPCLVYELIEGGQTLDDLLRASCPLPHAVQLLRDTARGLGHAHARGIVHRDVKPENVLVDVHGQAKVADFGIAGCKGLDQLTVTGTILGTPLYMAPETLGGQRDRVGPATDVWALGAMLYEVLAGLPPYTGESLVTLSVQVLEAPFPRIAPERKAPKALVEIARRALEKDPARRYADGDAFADALDAYLAGDRRESRPPLALLGLGALAVLAIVGVTAAQLVPPTASSPTPQRTSRASPTASPLVSTTASPIAPVQTYEDLARLSDPLERYRASRRWLTRNSKHASAGRILRSLSRGRKRPLRSGDLARPFGHVKASFAPDGRVLASSQSVRMGVGQGAGKAIVTAWLGTRLEWTVEVAVLCGVLPSKGGPTWWSTPPLRFFSLGPQGADAPPLLELADQAPYQVALSPRGDRLAVITADKKLLLVRWPVGPLEHTSPLPARPYSVVFGSKGERVFVGVGDSVANSFTTLRSEVLGFDAATGELSVRSLLKAPSAPLTLVLERLEDRILLGVSSGDLVRFDLDLQTQESVPAFATGDILNRTFTAGVQALAFDSSGETLYVALNSQEVGSSLLEIDWGQRVLRRTIPLSDETESLTISADDLLLLRGTRTGKWELWSTAAE